MSTPQAHTKTLRKAKIAYIMDDGDYELPADAQKVLPTPVVAEASLGKEGTVAVEAKPLPKAVKHKSEPAKAVIEAPVENHTLMVNDAVARLVKAGHKPLPSDVVISDPEEYALLVAARGQCAKNKSKVFSEFSKKIGKK